MGVGKEYDEGRRLERISQSWELYSCLKRLVAMERIRD
jgi:hypothetical protein